MKSYKPNYQNCLVNLSNSILKRFGVPTFHNTLKEVDDFLGDSQKVVLLLFDGMGTSIIEKHLSEKDYLRRHSVTTIDSVFPPTTVAATTALLSGKFPIENGWLGWTHFSKEKDMIITDFLGTNELTGEMIDPLFMYKHAPYDDITKMIGDKNPGLYSDSHWPSWKKHNGGENVHQFINAISRDLDKHDKCFIYGYWDNPDKFLHMYGTDSRRVKWTVKEINREVHRLKKMHPDTKFIVVADHSLIDIDWIDIRKYPDFVETLHTSIANDSRAAFFFVKEGCHQEFEKLFNKYFGEYYELYSKEEILKNRIFGDGTPHEYSLEEMGDYLAIATGKMTLTDSIKTNGHLFKGHHAGGVKEEFKINLILF